MSTCISVLCIMRLGNYAMKAYEFLIRKLTSKTFAQLEQQLFYFHSANRNIHNALLKLKQAKRSPLDGTPWNHELYRYIPLLAHNVHWKNCSSFETAAANDTCMNIATLFFILHDTAVSILITEWCMHYAMYCKEHGTNPEMNVTSTLWLDQPLAPSQPLVL